MKSTFTVGNSRTLFCKCGKEYTGKNAKLVMKLLSLHAMKAHGEHITANDINEQDTKRYNAHTNLNNPHPFNQPNMTRDIIQRQIMESINTITVC
jgi:hypothetical protein